MQHIAIVEILGRAEQIVHDGLDVDHLQVDARLDNLLEVTFSVVNHNIDCAEGSWFGWRNNLYEVDKIGVS